MDGGGNVLDLVEGLSEVVYAHDASVNQQESPMRSWNELGFRFKNLVKHIVEQALGVDIQGIVLVVSDESQTAIERTENAVGFVMVGVAPCYSYIFIGLLVSQFFNVSFRDVFLDLINFIGYLRVIPLINLVINVPYWAPYRYPSERVPAPETVDRAVFWHNFIVQNVDHGYSTNAWFFGLIKVRHSFILVKSYNVSNVCGGFCMMYLRFAYIRGNREFVHRVDLVETNILENKSVLFRL